MNLCTDQLLLLMADPPQIQSLSHLSHEMAASVYWKKAKRYPINKGLAEDILPYRPDLVIAGEFGGIATVNLLRKLGIRVETLPIANSLDEVYANLRQMGEWIGHTERANTIIQTMQQALDALDNSDNLQATSAQKPIAAVYDPNAYTVGDKTLRGETIKRAGWQNAGELLGIHDYGVLSLEAIVKLAPNALIESPYTQNTWSRAEAVAHHPALRRSAIQAQVISLPSRMTMCGGPWTVDVIKQLKQARLDWQAQFQSIKE